MCLFGCLHVCRSLPLAVCACVCARRDVAIFICRYSIVACFILFYCLSAFVPWFVCILTPQDRKSMEVVVPVLYVGSHQHCIHAPAALQHKPAPLSEEETQPSNDNNKRKKNRKTLLLRHTNSEKYHFEIFHDFKTLHRGAMMEK